MGLFLVLVFLGSMVMGIYKAGDSAGIRLKHLREENDQLRTENLRLRGEITLLKKP